MLNAWMLASIEHLKARTNQHGWLMGFCSMIWVSEAWYVTHLLWDCIPGGMASCKCCVRGCMATPVAHTQAPYATVWLCFSSFPWLTSVSASASMDSTLVLIKTSTPFLQAKKETDCLVVTMHWTAGKRGNWLSDGYNALKQRQEVGLRAYGAAQGACHAGSVLCHGESARVWQLSIEGSHHIATDADSHDPRSPSDSQTVTGGYAAIHHCICILCKKLSPSAQGWAAPLKVYALSSGNSSARPVAACSSQQQDSPKVPSQLSQSTCLLKSLEVYSEILRS